MADDKMSHWVSVAAKALAYLCLHQGKLAERKLADQALFLEALGLSTAEQAGMLGSTIDSITELKRVARKSKGGKGEKKGAASARTRTTRRR